MISSSSVTRRGLLDLRHHRGAAARELARLGDVGGALHEGKCDPVDADRQSSLQIRAVLIGHGRQGNDGIGKADALAAGKHPATQRLGVDPDVARLDHSELELAVVEEQRVARLNGLEDLRMRQVHAPQAADRLAADEAHDVSFGHADRTGFEFADAELRPLQIDKQADRPRELHLELADNGVGVTQGIGRRVAHIHAENVGARLEQGAHRLFVV